MVHNNGPLKMLQWKPIVMEHPFHRLRVLHNGLTLLQGLGVSGATAQAWQEGKGVSVKANTQDSTAQALEQFYQSVVNGKKVYADIKSGALTSKCVQMSLDAMYENKIAKWVDYPTFRF